MAGGMGDREVLNVFTAPPPARSPISAPLPVWAVRTGGLVSSLVLATRVNWPLARLNSARVMVTRSVNGRLTVARLLVGIATLLSAVNVSEAGNSGLRTDWAYHAPVLLASVRLRFGVWLVRVTVAGGGGAITKTSCWARRSPSSVCRE
ncbi:hypothetical protein D3C81_1627230 [compost metagenome]